jgi:hypothetical protein
MADETPAFVVRDRNYVSARWPGDIHTFAKTFSAMLKQLNLTMRLDNSTSPHAC